METAMWTVGTWRQQGHGYRSGDRRDLGTEGTWGQQGQQSPTPPAGAPTLLSPRCTPQHPPLHLEGWGLRGGAERDPQPYCSPQPRFAGQLRPSRAHPGGLAAGRELRPTPVCSLRGQECGVRPWAAASPGPFQGAQLAAGHETSPGPSCSSARRPGSAPRPAPSEQETPSPCPRHAGFKTFPPRWRLSPFLQAEPVAWQPGAQRHGLRPQPAASPLCQPLGSPWLAPRCPLGAGGGCRHPVSQPSPVAAHLPLPTLPDPAQTFLRNKEKLLRVLLCRLFHKHDFLILFFFFFFSLCSDVFLPRTCRDSLWGIFN
ncbi:synapsin-1-like isoform X2 [Oxyura jamaicensis]|uniref:synapsin-1-like isoform X2 n=1 Tax=Oxyura jamaicensis TaxID=8884 RepID=UPI0015A60646|nr:synapsin-1-like isoform X2 [Oxyura jamaicensis]